MNRYPLWKYILIGIVLLVGLIFTAPNFFGEEPAVQVSPVRATLKADAALLQRVEELLTRNGIKYEGDAIDPNGVRVRFEDADTQIRAKDVVQKALGEDY